ncbi:hypothetical protein BU23DRAFT_535818 [Bimuria novae-zelandiae CBS 107.79]|uniref:Wings apart-like protein C-terminal domain-containing protein n=1 Tax=Bimuria novae-zelandiae CBS 107.79 TaxID=1447943 RepID=A0A6A5V654_9PLEO|nr:hypothetical protein BU23DRAFT_535818 [Bimuria novae-zelandiae CBS 107.79]
MAMPMSSVFTGAERRKKVITYGRAARLSNAQIFTDDAHSPERPHKQAVRLPTGSQISGAASGSGDASHTSRVRQRLEPEPRDEFDVPSDDEPTPRAIPIKKSLPKQKPPPKPVDSFDAWDVPSSGDERRAAKVGKGKAVQPARKTKPQQQAKPQGKSQPATTHDLCTTAALATRTRAKTPVSDLKPSLAAQTRPTKQLVPAVKATSKRKPTPSESNQAVSYNKAKSAAVYTAKETVPTPPTESSVESAVFDVPSSDDDAPTHTPVRSRKPPMARSKVSPNASTSRAPLSPEASAESDTSNAFHKRKRRGSASSSVTVKRMEITERKRDASVSQTSRKYQKAENSVSPGHTKDDSLQPALMAEIHGPPASKPKRTRTRTVPVVSRSAIAKSQSSPVKLHSVLAMRSATKPSPVQETPEAPIAEDETMYDIREEATPLARGANSYNLGSVTPRQRDLFTNLLDGGLDMTTPMPSISKLRLTNRTPHSTVAALTRSSSNVPQSAHTRKGRLIDMLKRAVPSSEEETESDEESEQDIIKIPTVLSIPAPKTVRQDASQTTGEEMDIDQDTQSSSQASRPAPPRRDTSRTYANTRSYLEESNLEDGLLNWNEDIEFDMVDRQGSVTGSEDDSQQVTGLPELRRKGQLYKFEAETLAMIEDISGKNSTNISARRSAMMEFATQMTDNKFIDQLLESAMTSSSLRAIAPTGDMIFDFAAAAAILFMLKTKPSYAVVEQIYRSDILSTLRNLLSSSLSSFDIHRIAKERKTNMAANGRESVVDFRTLVLQTLAWSADDVPKLSPQLLAIKVLEELVIGLRTFGNTDSIVDESMIGKVLDAASGPSERLVSGKVTAQDSLILQAAISTLESLSLSKTDQATWPDVILRRLAAMMSGFFEATRTSPTRLAIRLCMNVSNGMPKACQIFAEETFVTRLTRFIVDCFKLLGNDDGEHSRAEVREDLILGLGAMMNLAEFSDQARMSVIQGEDDLIGELVKIFLEGSERAERADSMEESESLVPVGYLTIMLGNLCLNSRVRRRVTSLLPEKQFALLVQKVKEFVQYNQRVDQAEFEGAEGQQTLQNFTLRLMLVVERLEKAV